MTEIGDTMQGGYTPPTHARIPHRWKVSEFRRCYTNGPHQPPPTPGIRLVSSQQWKPVWRYA